MNWIKHSKQSQTHIQKKVRVIIGDIYVLMFFPLWSMHQMNQQRNEMTRAKLFMSLSRNESRWVHFLILNTVIYKVKYLEFSSLKLKASFS